MKRLLFGLSCILVGCGYQFVDHLPSESVASITIPYIKGDVEGVLNTELAKALSTSGLFDYAQTKGVWILEASIIADGDDRIGYRYDRNPTTGALRDNIVGTENRRAIAIEMKLVDANTEEVLLGPEVIRATADYDYVDGNSIRDLVFLEQGTPQTVLNFSLGQLSSVDGGHDDSTGVLYQRLAEKITERLLLYQLRKSTIETNAQQKTEKEIPLDFDDL